MKRKKPTNPLDDLIRKYSEEFSKIPNFSKNMQDADIRNVHTFIAVSISGIQSSKNLVIGSFIPAANKAIYETKNHIKTSAFKHILNTVHYDVESIRDETIRLGYVFTFHKFEVFIKQLISLLDSISDSELTPLEKYCKKVFEFNPTQWFRNPVIHLVNFISNCTKHQDGLCKLDNANYSIPDEFLFHPTDQKIKRTQQQYKDDIDILMKWIPILCQIIASINLYRIFENSIVYEDSYIDFDGNSKIFYTMDEESRTLINTKKKELFDTISKMITMYQN